MNKIYFLVLVILYTELLEAQQPYGTELGSFNGVISYSNGSISYVSNDYNYYNGTNTGMKWQCVEFVNRYYLINYGKNIRIPGTNANEYYGTASQRGVFSYPNDSTIAPSVGDILCFGGGLGHVAIIREVGIDYVRIVEQNGTNDFSDLDFLLDMTVSGGNYNISATNLSLSLFVQGWLKNQEILISPITLSGRSIRGIAFDSEFLWAIHSSISVGDVVRISKIDPLSGQILHESNDLPWNGRGITSGNGYLWIADALGDVIRKIDSSNFSQVNSFYTPGTEPNGITFDGINLWLTDPWFQKIYQLDTLGGIISSFNIPNEYRTGLEWESSGMWTKTDTNEISFYATSGTITSTKTFDFLPPGKSFYDIAIGNGKVYVSSGETIYIQSWSPSTWIDSKSLITNLPKQYLLEQNYPNPFNPSTVIRYYLPQRSFVKLDIYNLLGQVIEVLLSSEQNKGLHEMTWHSKVSSGIYFYRLSVSSIENPSEQFVDTKKMLLIR